jgi:hypothetical protein
MREIKREERSAIGPEIEGSNWMDVTITEPIAISWTGLSRHIFYRARKNGRLRNYNTRWSGAVQYRLRDLFEFLKERQDRVSDRPEGTHPVRYEDFKERTRVYINDAFKGECFCCGEAVNHFLIIDINALLLCVLCSSWMHEYGFCLGEHRQQRDTSLEMPLNNDSWVN